MVARRGGVVSFRTITVSIRKEVGLMIGAIRWRWLRALYHGFELFNRNNQPSVSTIISIEEQFKELQRIEPQAYDVWKGCYLAGERAYRQSPVGSLSVGEHPVAQAFGDFITEYLSGHVLDIGCGPQELPSYFEDIGSAKNLTLYGVDPLVGSLSRKPVYYRGFAELLPWQKICFDAVVIATSLDHCLSLDITLAEIKRVLKPGGWLLIWVGFIPNAEPYNPRRSDVKAIDEYHLFHFDRPWFEKLFNEHFGMQKVICWDGETDFFAFAN